MFGKIVSATLAFLGISAFAKDNNGKSILLSQQEEELKNKYGQTFVDAFKKDLAEFEKDGLAAESAVTAEVTTAMQAQLEEDKKLVKELKAEIATLKSDMDKLEKQPANAEGQEVNNDKKGMEKNFRPDMNLAMNRNYVLSAEQGYQYNSNETIDTTDLRQEFGRYISSEKLQIFKKLLAPTNSMSFMSTIITDKFQVRASQASITSVLQAFVPKWTPKGKGKFTPLTIESYPMKINVSVIPADVINDALGYLYDENLSPKDMPIVRYVVEQLVKPKLTEEREVAIAQGRYKEPVAGDQGAYTASAANDVCNGYLTQLCDLKKASNEAVTWLLDGTPLGDGATLLTNIEKAVDAVAPAYKNQHLTIHADPDLVLKYSRAYRDKYPYTKNEDGQKVKVDYTNFTFAGLEGMRGTGAFFITPKENFKHIISRNPESMKLYMQEQDYEAKIFGQWREGTGFWIAEAIFAYIPTELVTKLAPEVLAASTTTEEGGI